MNDQILESEKKIRDKANQEKGMFTYKLCYKKTRSHLGCTLQKLCHTLTCAFYKQFYIKLLSAYADLLTVFFPVFQTVYYFLFSSDQYTFLSFFSFFPCNKQVSSQFTKSKIDSRPQSCSNQVTTLQLTRETREITKVLSNQRAKKVVSDSPGLVDFAIGLVNSVFNLPDGQVMFFEEFE